MRFLIFGDLHGKLPKIHYRDFDAIIAPGDFCSSDARKYMFQALKKKVEWHEFTGRKKAREIIKKSLSDGRNVLERLNSFKVPVFIVPGNWDWTGDASDWNFLNRDHYKTILKGLKNVFDVDHKLFSILEYDFIGYGIHPSPEYPQNKEDMKRLESNLKQIKKEYESECRRMSHLFRKASKKVIFLSHNVPFNTPLDIILSNNSRYGQHFGSLIVRQMINKYKPLINVAGHMHEHFGKCKIGRTICVNAGYGPSKNILLEIEQNRIKRLEFHK